MFWVKLTAACPESRTAGQRPQTSRPPQQALPDHGCCCRWTVDEAETYLRYVAAKAAERGQQEWRFDMGWLEVQGCQIPPQLQPLCRGTPAL